MSDSLVTFLDGVKFIHGFFNFTFCNSRQVPGFRDAPPYESIGILIKSTFPGGIMMRKIDASHKVTNGRAMINRDLVRDRATPAKDQRLRRTF